MSRLVDIILRALAGLLFLAFGAALGAAQERAELTIGVPVTAFFFACTSEPVAVRTGELHVTEGYTSAKAYFDQNGLICAQSPIPVTLVPQRVVWHRELKDGSGSILNVVLMSPPGRPEAKLWVITLRKVVGSGIESRLPVTPAGGAEPRLVGGLFCDTAEQIDRMYQMTVVENRPANEAADTINRAAGKTACGAVPMRFVVEGAALRRKAPLPGGRTVYFYAGKVVGWVASDGRAGRFAQPVDQHFGTLKPFDPADAEQGA